MFRFVVLPCFDLGLTVFIYTFKSLVHISTAAEMKRHDQVAELLQHRQEKDIKQLNKVEYVE